MPGRGQANIVIWPKSSEYSRCLDITCNAKGTIGTFCSDFVVRECLHSLVATTLFIPFSEENKTERKRISAFFICWHVINKWHWLVHNNPPLRNSTVICKNLVSAKVNKIELDSGLDGSDCAASNGAIRISEFPYLASKLRYSTAKT